MTSAPDPFAHLTAAQRERLARVQTDARTRDLLLAGARPATVGRHAPRARADVRAVAVVSGDLVTVTAKGLRIRGEMNERDGWRAKHRRDTAAKRALLDALDGVQPSHGTTPIPGDSPAMHWRVTFTREGKNLLDTDNLAGGFKACRDAVASWLGCDDSPDAPVTWCYQQRRGRGYNAVVEIARDVAVSGVARPAGMCDEGDAPR